MIFIYYRLEEYVFYLRDVNGLKELRRISDEMALQFISYLKYQAGMDVERDEDRRVVP